MKWRWLGTARGDVRVLSELLHGGHAGIDFSLGRLSGHEHKH